MGNANPGLSLKCKAGMASSVRFVLCGKRRVKVRQDLFGMALRNSARRFRAMKCPELLVRTEKVRR